MPDKPNDGYYEAYWPRGPRQQKTRALAPRLDTLNGRTIAQLWDQLFKGDVVFEILEDYMIAVAGDPLRNNAYVFAHNGFLGYPVGKRIRLPANWARLLETRPASM